MLEKMYVQRDRLEIEIYKRDQEIDSLAAYLAEMRKVLVQISSDLTCDYRESALEALRMAGNTTARGASYSEGES